MKKRSEYIYRLLQYVDGHRGYLVISIISKLLLELLPIIMMTVAAYMISNLMIGDVRSIGIYITAILLLSVGAILFSILETYISHDMSYRILTGLRDKVYRKMNEAAPSGLGNRQSAELVGIILHDIEFFEWFYAHILTEWITVGGVVLLSFLFLGHFQLVLSIIVICVVVMIIAVPMKASKMADRQGATVRQTAGILNSEVVGGIQGIKDIISSGWKREYLNKFAQAAENYAQAEIDYGKRSTSEKRNITFMIDMAVLCGTIYVGTMIYHNQLEMVWGLPIIFWIRSIFEPVKRTVALSASYGYVFGAAKRVFDLLHIHSSVCDSGTLTEKDLGLEKQVIVKYENVVFGYQEEGKEDKPKVLDGISFQATRGTTTALVSKSGGGKTTIARLTQRFWDVNEGGIYINGTDIRNISLNQLRECVSVVAQDVYMFNRSVRENLQLAKADATEEEMRNACRLAQAHSFIEKLPQGYDTVIGERGIRLSGGEKQRISIAQAFLKNSPVLILDEASANLDVENEESINKAVEEIKKGRATIVIAHRISTIKKADKIVVIYDGKTAGEGTYEELMKHNSKFKEIIGEMQNE